jgi:hypothetical protein
MVYLTTDQRAMDLEKAKLVLMKVPVDTPGPMMVGEMEAPPMGARRAVKVARVVPLVFSKS